VVDSVSFGNFSSSVIIVASVPSVMQLLFQFVCAAVDFCPFFRSDDLNYLVSK